jgi:hypothetical protein
LIHPKVTRVFAPVKGSNQNRRGHQYNHKDDHDDCWQHKTRSAQTRSALQHRQTSQKPAIEGFGDSIKEPPNLSEQTLDKFTWFLAR